MKTVKVWKGTQEDWGIKAHKIDISGERLLLYNESYEIVASFNSDYSAMFIEDEFVYVKD